MIDISKLVDQSGMDSGDRGSNAAITTSCEKGADLTRRLLSFARKSLLDPRNMSLRHIVTDMLPLARRTLPTDIEIVWNDTAAARMHVNVDVGLLESSILNIFSMPAGRKVTITITQTECGADAVSQIHARPIVPSSYASLAISDTGTGIPKDLNKRATEPFVTIKGPELGSGLGLAMVEGFVAQSGGFLDIESVLGQGTILTLHIPASVTRGLAATAGQGQPAPAPPLTGRALLVEDEEQVRLVTGRILRRMGPEVVAVETASCA